MEIDLSTTVYTRRHYNRHSVSPTAWQSNSCLLLPSLPLALKHHEPSTAPLPDKPSYLPSSLIPNLLRLLCAYYPFVFLTCP